MNKAPNMITTRITGMTTTLEVINTQKTVEIITNT